MENELHVMIFASLIPVVEYKIEEHANGRRDMTFEHNKQPVKVFTYHHFTENSKIFQNQIRGRNLCFSFYNLVLNIRETATWLKPDTSATILPWWPSSNNTQKKQILISEWSNVNRYSFVQDIHRTLYVGE